MMIVAAETKVHVVKSIQQNILTNDKGDHGDSSLP